MAHMFAELSGGPSGWLRSPLAKARAAGTPHDPTRLPLFDRLMGALRVVPRMEVPWGAARKGEARRTLAFFDAYFSNYIEGTELTVEQAVGIIFEARQPAQRAADAQDMLGLWQVVSDMDEMGTTPKTPDELLEILRRRHAMVMRDALRPNLGGLNRFATASVPRSSSPPKRSQGRCGRGSSALRRWTAVRPGCVHALPGRRSASVR